MIKHEESHRAMWIGGGNKTSEHPFGDPIAFVCNEWHCEVNHGGYDCPSCKKRGYRRVMDSHEKADGICGDCGLSQAFTSGKFGNGLMIERTIR